MHAAFSLFVLSLQVLLLWRSCEFSSSWLVLHSDALFCLPFFLRNYNIHERGIFERCSEEEEEARCEKDEFNLTYCIYRRERERDLTSKKMRQKEITTRWAWERQQQRRWIRRTVAKKGCLSSFPPWRNLVTPRASLQSQKELGTLSRRFEHNFKTIAAVEVSLNWCY